MPEPIFLFRIFFFKEGPSCYYQTMYEGVLTFSYILFFRRGNKFSIEYKQFFTILYAAGKNRIIKSFVRE